MRGAVEVETPDRGAFAESSTSGRLRHQPGLDGLRGLAVLAVPCFHTGRGWLSGGYFGGSLSFTVSGTVIGSVLLLDADRTGAVSVRDFLGRRSADLAAASLPRDGP
jgi:peptidoglycan/LPS O-acetylase OafA/YrhL